MALPALLASLLGRAVVARAGATATGAQAAATANRESATWSRMNPAQRHQHMLDREAQQATQRAQRLSGAFQQLSYRTHQAETFFSNWTRRFVGGLNHANAAIAGMAEPVRQLVALANPAKAHQFELAARDSQAVIGRQLVPEMEAFTRLARKTGDTMAAFEPVLEPLHKSIAGLIDTVGDDLNEVLLECAPAIESVTDALVDMVDAAREAAKELPGDKDSRRGFFNGMAGATPDEQLRLNRKRTGLGAAAQEARFIGAKSVADEAIKNALTLAMTNKPAAKPPEQSLQSIDEKMGELVRIEKAKAGDRNQAGPRPDPGQAIRQANTRPY